MSKTILASIISVLFLLTASSVAWACSGYQWSGKKSSLTWQGVEGNLSVDGESIGNDTGYHILNYIDMSNFNYGCQGFTSCWIQAGDSLGFTGASGYSAYCQSNYIQAYVEVGDVNSYGCYGYTSSQLSLTQNDYYTTYFTQTCNSSGDGLTDAYVYNTNVGWALIGQAWIPNCAASTIFAQSEFDEFGGTTCPVLQQYQYFGYYGGPLNQSPNGLSWQSWTTSLQHGPDSPLNLSPNPVTSSDSFAVWG